VHCLQACYSYFEKEALKALEMWRYAPKFVEGKAVTAKDLKVRLNFTLGANRSSLKNL